MLFRTRYSPQHLAICQSSRGILPSVREANIVVRPRPAMEIGGTKSPQNHGPKVVDDRKSRTSSIPQPPTSNVHCHGQSRRQLPQTSSSYEGKSSNDGGIVGGDTRGRMSSAQIQAQTYLNEKKIFELFNFLIGHLLVDEPPDPVEYLVDLLDKCMLFRAGLRDPPLLFTAKHVESMFQSLDPGGLGSISLDQYKAGMTTLGIGCYDMNPKTCGAERVDKQTFQEEATKCLVNMLTEMISKKP